MKRKKFSIYEIEKMTKGHLSKYKLKKAIQDGDLVAEYHDPESAGRGAAKYLITEEALNRYMKNINKNDEPINSVKQYHSKEEQENLKLSLESNKQTRETKEEIAELKNRIQFLENQTAKMEPLLRTRMKDIEDEMKRDQERREIMLELANINFLSLFSQKKKHNLLRKLNQLL